jgi:hypothetical protein
MHKTKKSKRKCKIFRFFASLFLRFGDSFEGGFDGKSFVQLQKKSCIPPQSKVD